MKRQMSWALLAGGIALAVSAASAVPAAAAPARGYRRRRNG